MSTGISDQRMKGQGNQGMFGPSFGQQSSYNYFPNNGENYNKNAWDSQQVNGGSRRYDDYNRGYDKQRSYGNEGTKSIEHGMQGMGLDGGNQRDSYTAKTNSQNTTSSAQPKKTTWASIASQPVKSSQTRISSTLKKKPGMPSHIKVPPPPMIPGKINLDVGSESEKNGALVPPPVPSPPPVIDEPSPFQQFPTKNHNNANNNSSNNNSEQFPTPSNRNDYRDDRSGQMNRDRDSDRGPMMNRDRDQRDGGWHRRDNGYYPQNRYQPRSNYGPPNHDRQMNYQENRNYQPRPHYRSSPPHNQYYGPSRNENTQEPPTPPPPAPKVEADAPKPAKADECPPTIEKVLDKNNYNPPELDQESLDKARFFVIKSYSEDDVHRSIKYEIWCSTEHGNKRLDQAFRDAESDDGLIYLLFSVNGSGHFCGVAQMTSAVDYNSVSSVWHQDKWKGKFSLKWIYVKDVPNAQLRHIRLENNENKSVTNSRDTQEVPNPKGQQVMQIIHTFGHSTSIFDDIEFYEQRQVEEDTKRVDIPPPPPQHDNDERGAPKRGFHRNDGNYRDGERGGGYDGGYRPNRNHGNYVRDQGNNRGYHNSYDNRRGGDDFSRNYDRPPPNRDYNRGRDGGQGGFMSRDRGDRDNNRFEYRDRMERNDDHHSGGFKRNYSNNFGNRGSNGPNSSYRNDRNDRHDRNERIERSDRMIERREHDDDDDHIERN